MTTENNINHTNEKLQEGMDANDLVFVKNSNGEYSGGGFSINSALMKQGISPMTTISGGTSNGESVSDLFNHMVVPAGLMGPISSLKNSIVEGGYSTDDNDDKSVTDEEEEEEEIVEDMDEDEEFDDLGDEFDLEFGDSDEDEDLSEDEEFDDLGDEDDDLISLDNDEEVRLDNQKAVVPDYLFEELFKLSVYVNPVERNSLSNTKEDKDISISDGGKKIHKNRKRHNLTRHKSKKFNRGRKTRKR
jgi:hypothetical protein